MSDLISRKVVIELIRSSYPSAPIMRMNKERWEKKYKPYIEAEKAVEMLPSAESEIIRCRDCKHHVLHPRMGVPWCRLLHSDMGDNQFCSYAERGEWE